MDAVVAGSLAPLAAVILFSGIDDLIVDAIWLWRWVTGRLSPRWRIPPPGERQLDAAPQRRIAIFVPCWREHEVIGQMLQHNLAAIRYRNYDFFVGAYPNDDATLDAVREMEARFSNVHLAVCPHDGPTSKADCLNWIYQHLTLFEENEGCRFDVIVTHDAEDIVHPEALRWINFYSARYAMVQVPVLALPTAFRAFTHGVYCDEFAEYQARDMIVRQYVGAFVPSTGVGTGYRRDALESLARAESNRVFEPSALTEDYENGLRLKELGASQMVVPPVLAGGGPLATREYFPQRWRAAVRQRTRWTTGIVFQAWERHGWRGDWRQRYWLWRDRKGLLGNPVSLLANLFFAYGVVTWIASIFAGAPWGLGRVAVDPVTSKLLATTLAIQMIRTTVRFGCVRRVYGWRFALGVPIRAPFANAMNSTAAVRALFRYAVARLRRRPLVWVKTEHAYPSRAMLLTQRRKLGEILTGSSYLAAERLEAALRSQPAGVRLGEHLVNLGWISEDDLYEALSLQQGLPAGRISPREVSRNVARALPAHVVHHWNVLPFKIAAGRLFLAGPDYPGENLNDALRHFTRLEIRFQLVTPSNFRDLKEQLL